MLIGNLTRDPNLRYTPSNTAVCSFGIATNRSWTTSEGELEERTDFHNLVAWAKLAEICDQILRKGDKVYVEGRIQTRDWKSDDEQDRRVTEVVLDSMIKLGSPRSRRRDSTEEDEALAADEDSEKEAKASSEQTESEEKEVDVDEVSDEMPF